MPRRRIGGRGGDFCLLERPRLARSLQLLGVESLAAAGSQPNEGATHGYGVALDRKTPARG